MGEISDKRESREESLKNSLKGDTARRAVGPELDGQKAAPRAVHSNDKASQRKPEAPERPKASTAVDRAGHAVRTDLDVEKATPRALPSNDKTAARKLDSEASKANLDFRQQNPIDKPLHPTPAERGTVNADAHWEKPDKSVKANERPRHHLEQFLPQQVDLAKRLVLAKDMVATDQESAARYRRPDVVAPTPASDAADEYKRRTGINVFTGTADLAGGEQRNAGLVPELSRNPFVPELQKPRYDREPKGYGYRVSYDIGKVTDLTNANSAMKMLQDDPNKYFPFGIRGVDGKENVKIREGAVLELVGPRLDFFLPAARSIDTGHYVVVRHVTDTQFTFQTLQGHFDGPGGLISFRMYQQDGRIRLEQTAWADHAGAFNARISLPGATRMAWPAQADNLRREIFRSDPILQVLGK